MHYDIIPVLYPELTHTNTYPIFIEHLNAHLQYSDLFICISKNSQLDLLTHAQEVSQQVNINTTTIRLGADTPNTDTLQQGLPEPLLNNKYILCVGTIEPRKNHQLLLDAFEHFSHKLPDVILVLVGRSGWHADELINRIKNNEWYQKRVFWLDRINDELLGEIYKHAFLTVIPSLYEGFGLPVIEALQHGCVTLSSNKGALTEAGGEYADYFDPDDLEALTSLLDAHLDTDRWLVKKNRLKSYHPSGWDETARELVTILQNNYRDWKRPRHDI